VDLVEDITFSLSGNKKLLTKDLHHFCLLGKYYFNFTTSFNYKISPQRRGQKSTPLGETLPKKHH